MGSFVVVSDLMSETVVSLKTTDLSFRECVVSKMRSSSYFCPERIRVASTVTSCPYSEAHLSPSPEHHEDTPDYRCA